MDYILYLLAGALAGFLSGLFGLGGGVIIVPVLIFMFTASNLSVEIITHLAIGTSLATIVVTSISSALTHHQKGAVRWDLIRWIVPGILLGAVLGGLFAVYLSGPMLQLLFGILLVVVAFQLLLSPTYRVVAAPRKLSLVVPVSSGRYLLAVWNRWWDPVYPLPDQCWRLNTPGCWISCSLWSAHRTSRRPHLPVCGAGQ